MKRNRDHWGTYYTLNASHHDWAIRKEGKEYEIRMIGYPSFVVTAKRLRDAEMYCRRFGGTR